MAESFAKLARISDLIYDQVEGWDDYVVVEGVVIARTGNTLVLRGSTTLTDWLHDADCLPQWHETLGFCHRGFLSGMDQVYDAVKGLMKPGFAVTGHSLGGARARILAALFVANGFAPERVVTFGSPKPGMINLRRILEKSATKHFSFRNRNDVVPTLPHVFDYVHTEDWTAVNAAPTEDNFDALRDHSMKLYVKALSNS